MIFAVFVRGVPIPQGSKTILPGCGSGRPVMVESSNRKTKSKPANRLKKWRESIVAAVISEKLNLGLDRALSLRVTFFLPPPKSRSRIASRFPCVKPDLSKLVRAVEDALEQSGAVTNDSRFVRETTEKLYADTKDDKGEWLCGARIELEDAT